MIVVERRERRDRSGSAASAFLIEVSSNEFVLALYIVCGADKSKVPAVVNLGHSKELGLETAKTFMFSLGSLSIETAAADRDIRIT